MPDGTSAGPEIGIGIDTRTLDQSGRFIHRLRDRTLIGYPDAKRLLEEGSFSEEDMKEPYAEIGTSTWDYTIVRMKADYLDLQIQRTPRDKGSKVQMEKIRIVYGEEPSYEYSKTIAGQVSQIVSSIEDPISARRRVRRFIEEMEAQF